jgi:hypothetical protein
LARSPSSPNAEPAITVATLTIVPKPGNIEPPRAGTFGDHISPWSEAR